MFNQLIPAKTKLGLPVCFDFDVQGDPANTRFNKKHQIKILSEIKNDGIIFFANHSRINCRAWSITHFTRELNILPMNHTDTFASLSLSRIITPKCAITLNREALIDLMMVKKKIKCSLSKNNMLPFSDSLCRLLTQSNQFNPTLQLQP